MRRHRSFRLRIVAAWLVRVKITSEEAQPNVAGLLPPVLLLVRLPGPHRQPLFTKGANCKEWADRWSGIGRVRGCAFDSARGA